MKRHAEISACGSYRYLLERWWEPRGRLRTKWLTVCMLNPSTADALLDDATIRWLIGWAKKHGYTGLRVVNMAAFRATSPKDMLRAADPHGPENGAYLRRYCAGKTVMCAWGANGRKLPKYAQMLHELRDSHLVCIDITKDGSPCHPLRKSHNLNLRLWTESTHGADL